MISSGDGGGDSASSFLDRVRQTERSGVPELDVRAALDEAPRRIPLPEADRVVERTCHAVERAGRLDVGAPFEQRIEHLHVVTARGPVQRRLACAAPRSGS